MNQKRSLVLNQRKSYKWDEGIFIILTILIVIPPIIFYPYSTPAFAPIKDLLFQTLVLLGLTIWVLKIITSKSISWQASCLGKPVFLYLLWGCLSLFWSVNIYNSVLALPLFLAGPILFFIIINSIREQKTIDRLILIIIIVGLCFGIYGILQYLGIDFKFWAGNVRRQRVMGLFGNVNYFAEYLILPLSLTIGLILTKNKIFNKFFLLLALLAMGLTLLFTFTRGSYLAIVIAIPVMLLLYFTSAVTEQTKKLYKKIILIFLLLIIIAIALIYIPHPLNRKGTTLGTLKSRVTIETLTSSSSILRRVAIWKCTWMMIEDYPILGSGLGTYAYHTLKYQADFFAIGNNRDIYPHGKAVQAHNEYLQLWSELGIIGLLFFLWIILAYYKNIFINIGKIGEKQRAITIGLAGGITTVLIDAIFGFPLQLAASISLFWMFLGLSICQINIALQGKREIISNERRTGKNQKSAVEDNKKKISILENKAIKGMAYTIVIALMIICILFLTRPFVARVYYYYGDDLITKTNKNNEAIELYKKGIRMNPWLGELHYSIGVDLLKRGFGIPALEYLHQAEKFMDFHHLPQSIAYLYLSRNNYDKAIPYFEKAIKYQSNRKDMLPFQIQLANIYLAINDYQKAEQHLIDAIKYNPKSAEAHYGLANVYMGQNKNEEAIIALERVIEIAPQSEFADNAKTMLIELVD